MTYPNYKNKHDKPSIVTPEGFFDYTKEIGNAPDYPPPVGIILCYQRSLLRKVAHERKVTKMRGFWGEGYLLDETGGEIAIYGNFGIGAPAAVAHFEDLVAFGTRNFISIGTAGTLQKELDFGSIVVCEKAIRDEGTSHHYLKSEKYAYPSPILTGKMIDNLSKVNKKYTVGTSWTIDAPYRETVAEVKKYRDEGVLAVEMEAAALFAVAEYRKIGMAALITISDSLAELKWNPQFHSKKTDNGLDDLFKIALQTLADK